MSLTIRISRPVVTRREASVKKGKGEEFWDGGKLGLWEVVAATTPPAAIHIRYQVLATTPSKLGGGVSVPI